jgi:hypothetical protein
MAHKKAGGSSRNGRDSAGRRLGVKKFGGEPCSPATSSCVSAGPAGTRAPTSASARTIPSLRLPTAGSRSATGSSAASSSVWTCLRKAQRNRDGRQRAVPRRGGSRSRKRTEFEGEEPPGSSPFSFLPRNCWGQLGNGQGPRGRREEEMFARTTRLLLRPGWSQDAPALYRAIADERIVRNLATAPWPYGLDDAEAFLATERKASEPSLLIFLHGNGAPELIGGIGFGRRPTGETEFGYWLARGNWGRGYATEAGRALLATARHGSGQAARRRPFPRQSRVRPGAREARLQAHRNDRPALQRRPRRNRALPTVQARAGRRGRDGSGDGGLINPPSEMGRGTPRSGVEG